MRYASVAVVIPALDEEESLPGTIGALPPVGRVVVVDNGSTDDTARVARQAGATVVDEPRRGYGTAVQAGLAFLDTAREGRAPDGHALRSEAPPQVVVVLDADHSDRPQLLPRLVDPVLDDRADLVLSDRSRTAAPGALTWPQRFGNALATGLMALATGHRYADMGPFRAFRWDRRGDLGLTDPTWGWNVEMQMRAAQNGLRILEVPVPYGARRAGRSKISGDVRGAARAGVRILQATLRYARPRPPGSGPPSGSPEARARPR